MERKIVYLVNPISGTSRKDGIKKLIEKESTDRSITFEIMHTNAGGHYQLLREKIRAEHITDVVIIGGDGTVNQVTQALQGLPVRFGIIPLGSGNGLALAARIPTKPELALSLIFEGKSRPIDAFMVNEHYSCMLSGIGFDAQVAHDFASKASRGLLTYTQQSIINYFRANPYQFEIKLDNFSFFSDAFLSASLTVTSLEIISK